MIHEKVTYARSNNRQVHHLLVPRAAYRTTQLDEFIVVCWWARAIREHDILQSLLARVCVLVMHPTGCKIGCIRPNLCFAMRREFNLIVSIVRRGLKPFFPRSSSSTSETGHAAPPSHHHPTSPKRAYLNRTIKFTFTHKPTFIRNVTRD